MMNETISGMTGDFQTNYVVPAYDYTAMWAQQGIQVGAPAGKRQRECLCLWGGCSIFV